MLSHFLNAILFTFFRPCSDLVPPDTKMHVVHLRHFPGQKWHNYQDLGVKFAVGSSAGCENVNTAGTVKTCSD